MTMGALFDVLEFLITNGAARNDEERALLLGKVALARLEHKPPEAPPVPVPAAPVAPQPPVSPFPSPEGQS